MDLFTKQLSEVVQQVFEGSETGDKAITASAQPVEDRVDLPLTKAPGGTSAVDAAEIPKMEMPADSIPARMLNEFVYCPRLFYYEHVEGVFVESADTVRGEVLHARVDKGSGAMPKAKSASDDTGGAERKETKPSAEADEIHSRSVMLGSDRLGVVAKMDLVESTLDEGGNVETVCPVDYKAGSPREGENGLELWGHGSNATRPAMPGIARQWLCV